MNKITRLIVAAAALLLAGQAFASEVSYGDNLVYNTSLAYSTTVPLNLNENEVDTLAMQASYSSSTLSTVTFDDGRPATGTITVLSTQTLTSARLAINGYVLDQGVHWTAVSTTTGTAKAISDAIMAHPYISAVISSTWTSSVVYATATATGASGNAITLFSSVSSITVSGATLTNGTTSDVSVANDTIETITRHAWTTGVPVLFSTVSASTPPTGLTNQTTYYAIVVTPYQIKLAASSANSQVGTAVNITAQATLGGGSFTLAPLSTAGTFSFKWQVSNDNTNWTDLATTAAGVSVSSVTFATPFTATSSIWDFGAMNWAYIRANILAGSAGAWNLRIRGNGKKFR
jgi:hypothetical protein